MERKQPFDTRRLGPETARSHERRLKEGFYKKYLSGKAILDIGYRGGDPEALPVTEHAIGIELDYPNYDGVHLPFGDCTQDAVFASHTLEHIEDWMPALKEWFRVLKVHGYLIVAVPHQWLYERKAFLPSRFNGDHKRFYTACSLMREVEAALPVACWRLRSLRDIDEGFSYSRQPDLHPVGCYEIEMVVEKIERPEYADKLVRSPHTAALLEFFARLTMQGLEIAAAGKVRETEELQAFLATLPLPSFWSLLQHLPSDIGEPQLKAFLKPIVSRAPFEEPDYLARYPDIQQAVEKGQIKTGKDHYVTDGYFEGRFSKSIPEIFA